MKKLLLCIAILVLSISSCITKAGIVFDESVPLEQTSRISTLRVGTITAYNEIAVNWSPREVVQIPVGDTLLEFDLYAQEYDLNARWGDIIYTAKGVLFRYDFQPEKFYCFLLMRDENDNFGFGVYAWDYGEPWGIIGKKHFVEFVPLLNLGDAEGPTVLN